MSENFTFIIPCYNESKQVLEETIQNLKVSIGKSSLRNYEIIVVNDGSKVFDYVSPDEEHIIICHHEFNRGYGAALKTGIKKARYDWIGITDADGTYPNDKFHELLEHRTDYDMVIGARRWRGISAIRKGPKKLLTFFAGFLSDENIPDLNSGMRIFRKETAFKFWHLFPNGFSFTSTLTMACITHHYNVRFHEIDYYVRVGKSSIHPIKDTVRFFTLVKRLALYFNPKKFFLPLSSLFIILGFLRGCRDYISDGGLGGVTLLLFFVAFQIFFFGLLAEIINKYRLYLSSDKIR